MNARIGFRREKSLSKSRLVLSALLLAISFAGSCAPTFCAKASRLGIFSLSTRSQSSRALGADGVPAYVATARGSRRGFYITAVGNGGNWRRMGLQPGDLLISVNNRIITDASQADSVLSSISGLADITIARTDDDNVPQFVNSRVSISGADMATKSRYGSPKAVIGNYSTHQDSIDSLESYGLDLVNADRSREGKVPPLRMHPGLQKLARDYAQYMLERHHFAHVDAEGRDPMDRAKLRGIRAPVFENLAFQSFGWGNDRQMVDAAEKSMMNEPPNQKNHRGNILSPAHHYVGIGVARNNEALYMVQEFTDSDP
jgi:uncharacterized protein YkwD